ncbi:Trm112 family protein [bacterium]|nr:Trm112 family protein [bacterium]
MIDKKLLEILACPKCKKQIVFQHEKNIFKCSCCQNEYQVKNDIPVLMVEH